MNQDPFKEYIRESEPNKREKGYAWQTAIGQLVRAPPCHGGGRGFESHPGRFRKELKFNKYIWDLSSAGRASALQAEGHRFKSCRSHLCRRGGTGRRTGLKILRDLYSRIGSIPIAGIS